VVRAAQDDKEELIGGICDIDHWQRQSVASTKHEESMTETLSKRKVDGHAYI
jgi:hypothetical protein